MQGHDKGQQIGPYYKERSTIIGVAIEDVKRNLALTFNQLALETGISLRTLKSIGAGHVPGHWIRHQLAAVLEQKYAAKALELDDAFYVLTGKMRPDKEQSRQSNKALTIEQLKSQLGRTAKALQRETGQKRQKVQARAHKRQQPKKHKRGKNAPKKNERKRHQAQRSRR